MGDITYKMLPYTEKIYPENHKSRESQRINTGRAHSSRSLGNWRAPESETVKAARQETKTAHEEDSWPWPGSCPPLSNRGAMDRGTPPEPQEGGRVTE